MRKGFPFHWSAAAAVALGLQLAFAHGAAAQSGAPAAEKNDPRLKLRPSPSPNRETAPEGRLRLDVVVADGAGHPVAGLGAQDFQVFDNGRPQRLVSFHASDGSVGSAGSRLAVLLVLDAVNSGLQAVGAMRAGAEAFLRQNGGHLAQPVTVLLLTDAGFQVVGRTSLDGNLLAQAVHAIPPGVHTIHSAAGGEAALERFQLSGKALGAIAAHEVPIPGRKLMIWMGPGWPIMPRQEVTYNARSHALNFQALAELTNQLRQARMTICSAGGGSEFFVRDYLKPVTGESDANSDNLALQVLAVHTGGQTLDPGNGSYPAALIDSCMQSAGAYYTLTFDPSTDGKPMEYHALKVTVDKAGLSVHADAGYYGQP